MLFRSIVRVLERAKLEGLVNRRTKDIGRVFIRFGRLLEGVLRFADAVGGQLQKPEAFEDRAALQPSRR